MLCECGCGEKVLGGFKPGHDQNPRIGLEQRVDSPSALRSLVEASESFAAGLSTSDALIDKVRSTFGRVQSPSGQRGDSEEIMKEVRSTPEQALCGTLASPYRNRSGSMSDNLGNYVSIGNHLSY
jgi:hypothetical protein